ncbi:MAG TPA: hypothetical protein VIN06_03755 [Devosia sp.]
MPDVLSRLASALGRNDERPNVELAKELAAGADTQAIAALVEALSNGSVAVQNDAIKVLYEIGAQKSALVAPHTGAFFALLGSKNNRNVWGALQAVDTVTGDRPEEVLAELPRIIAAADKGSVIAEDKAISILARLAAVGHSAKILPILIERVASAAPNQFPMYAEIAAPVIDAAHRADFIAVLEARLRSIDAPAKRKRVEKVLSRLRARF